MCVIFRCLYRSTVFVSLTPDYFDIQCIIETTTEKTTLIQPIDWLKNSDKNEKKRKKKRKHRNSIYFKQNCTLRNADFSGIELLNDYVFI